MSEPVVDRTAYDLRGRRAGVWHDALDAVLEGRIAAGLGDPVRALSALDRAVHELGALRPAVVVEVDAARIRRRRAAGG